MFVVPLVVLVVVLPLSLVIVIIVVLPLVVSLICKILCTLARTISIVVAHPKIIFPFNTDQIRIIIFVGKMLISRSAVLSLPEGEVVLVAERQTFRK